MPRKTRTSKLTSMIVDDLNQKESTLNVELLVPFQNHPFQPYRETKMRDMVESIRENGILSPIIVRPKDEHYEIIAGHNRWNGAKLAGLNNVPVIIKEIDDDTATLLMIDTNFHQRETILPSEKAFAYQMRMNALRHQGQKADATLCHSGTKWSAEQIAQENQDSARQVYRYIQLTNLIQPLLDKVDSGDLGFISGVDISSLTPKEQTALNQVIEEHSLTISKVQASELKKQSAEKQERKKSLTKSDIDAILQPKKTPHNSFSTWKISGKQFQKKLPDTIASSITPEQAEEIFTQAMALWVKEYQS